MWIMQIAAHFEAYHWAESYKPIFSCYRPGKFFFRPLAGELGLDLFFRRPLADKKFGCGGDGGDSAV